METDYIPFQRDLYMLHTFVTMTADVMLTNIVPFLSTQSIRLFPYDSNHSIWLPT